MIVSEFNTRPGVPRKSQSEGLFTPRKGMSRTGGSIRVETAHDDMDRDRVGA
jgi:hypothetical protein